MSQSTILRGGQIIDPAQGLNKFTDLTITDGKIAAIGDAELSADADVVDVSGMIVTPGWVDIHVHAYGDLGFAYPDYIGINGGVTTFVDAGGTRIWQLPGIQGPDDRCHRYRSVLRPVRAADGYRQFVLY